MTTLGELLLVLGLIFPAISLFTAAVSLWISWRENRHSSPVFIPIIGPILLTCYLFVDDRSLWWLPVVWVLDIGTLAFAAVMPRLLREWWEVSSFTRIMTLHGQHGIQHAVMTLHTTGHYLLKKTWKRPPGDCGIVGLGETGCFSIDGDHFELVSHHNLRRQLVRIDDHSFRIEEQLEERPELSDYSLNGWTLVC